MIIVLILFYKDVVMIDSTISKYLNEGKPERKLKSGVDISGNEKSLSFAFGQLSKAIAKSKETNVDAIKAKVLGILDSDAYTISDATRYKNKQILKTKKDLFSLLKWINDVYLKGSDNAVIGSKRK